ncbi:coiled-coil domain-containing protein [Cohnella fermenti]|uniref:Uncharacterized protein n=1 Tax=Cohnella fermenti TaxID=2565925 RepID=A0A4S4BLY6_9BACL|nr:hypothetical protein [Cohnella fermenti]THF75613.1 hypothetical protein E6C55_21385 [Cohnella fermenti]
MLLRRLCLILSVGFILFALLPAAGRGTLAPPVYAAPSGYSEETRKLLEKGLTVVEIDREIERISGLRSDAETQIEQSSNELSRQELAIAAKREQAGRVLRTYYMGQKDAMWAALLGSRSLKELLSMWEMMDMLMSSDHEVLNKYETDYETLQNGYRALERNKDELAQVEAELRAQRERIESLQRELDALIAASGDEEGLRKMMDEMEAYWQNVGLYEVKKQFRALSKAMSKLPDWLKKHPDALETSGLKATLTITDEQLNEFLRAQDEQLADMTIAFEADRMILEGRSGDVTATIEGSYTIENDPKNAILFHVDKLVFNGLELPDTTREDLEREFDLGFYPQQFLSYIKADSVELEDGKLVVGLRFGK